MWLIWIHSTNEEPSQTESKHLYYWLISPNTSWCHYLLTIMTVNMIESGNPIVAGTVCITSHNHHWYFNKPLCGKLFCTYFVITIVLGNTRWLTKLHDYWCYGLVKCHSISSEAEPPWNNPFFIVKIVPVLD